MGIDNMNFKDICKRIIGEHTWSIIKRKVKLLENNYEGVISVDDWETVFRTFTINTAYRNKELENFVSNFWTAKLEKVSVGNHSGKGPILVCLEKNDLTRVKELVMHYKAIGVENMVFIDNDSDDGSVDWLKSIDNVDIYTVRESYTTIRREAWINRVFGIYGYDRWYIVVDSDEFIVYNNMDIYKIDSLITWAENKKLKTVRGMMLDMYAKEMFSSKEIVDFRNVCKYFDADGYYEEENKFFRVVKGGVRERAMGTSSILTKYPLFYFEKGVIEESSHYRFPYNENLTAPCIFAILHYKFIDYKDFEKIKDRVINKNYADGSMQYKGYMDAYQKNEHLNLLYDKSCIFNNCNDISNVREIELWN